MTIKNFDGCVAKLRTFRDNLQELLQAVRGFYDVMPPSLQKKWDDTQRFGAAIISTAPTAQLLTMFQDGQEAVASALSDTTGSVDNKFATVIAFQIVLSELGPRLDAAIDAATSGDQIETEASALDEERPDFDEGSDSDYDRAVSEGFVASQTAVPA